MELNTSLKAVSAGDEGRPAGNRSGQRIDILVPNLSGNSVGRALVFADLLSAWDVRLLGPSSGRLWPPLLARRDIHVVPCGPLGWRSTERTSRKVDAGIVIAIKPLLPSFGAALRARSAPVIVLDIDDPELALLYTNPRAVARTFASPLGIVPTTALTRKIKRAHAITVSGPVLARRYGGTIVPHARDEEIFDERAVRDRWDARRHLGFAEHEAIAVFLGTVRSHKGVDLLGEVASQIQPARLFVVGADRPQKVPKPVVAIGPVPYSVALRWLAAADVVLVPQRPGWIGAAQVPAKLSDGLAVGRAMVASDLPPIRALVGDAAVLVRPGSATALATAVRTLLDDPRLRARLEESARRRFHDVASFAVVRPRLLSLLNSLMLAHGIGPS